MFEIASCILQEHDLRLVALAVIVVLIGSAATVQLFGRIVATHGRSRAGWIALAAVGLGTMVWCTHFAAMMGFKAGVPVTLDPALTVASLGVAIAMAAPGLALATGRKRGCALLGGAVVGAAVSAMHYVGMLAYRVDGLVEWRWSYVVASVLLSSIISAFAFYILRGRGRHGRVVGGLLLALSVAVLHFTGMAAIKVIVMVLNTRQGLSDIAMTQLALGTAGAGLLFIGCAVVSALIDRETQNEAVRRLRRMALHDGLTDLPNRQCFNEELDARRERGGGAAHMAVVMLDLARFKSVNDTYGHRAGDDLLFALANRMRENLQHNEFFARLGGDEFAALFSYDEREELDAFLQRLADVFATPFKLERFAATLGANIGIALAPEDGTEADILLARADLAMYRAKSKRSQSACFYDPKMDDVAREQRELANDLRTAIVNCAFELHYQVQASIDGEVNGYEALVRWRHPSRGLISPLEFVPLAESIGEIVPLSNWIIAQACREAAGWPSGHPVSVNLSPLHLSDPGLIDTLEAALRDSGLSPRRLTVELTESAIIRDRRFALDQLRAIREMGIGLALDDFGVGYSSLDVLRSFSFDRIKLDKSFVDEIETDTQALAILRSIIALGSTLGIPVLAEGIEEPGQLRIVAEEGCSAIQGFLIGRPSRSLTDPLSVCDTMSMALCSPGAISMAA